MDTVNDISQTTQNYDANEIQVLEGLEAVPEVFTILYMKLLTTPLMRLLPATAQKSRFPYAKATLSV